MVGEIGKKHNRAVNVQISLKALILVVPKTPIARRELKEDLDRIGSAGLLNKPWNIKDEGLMRETVAVPSATHTFATSICVNAVATTVYTPRTDRHAHRGDAFSSPTMLAAPSTAATTLTPSARPPRSPRRGRSCPGHTHRTHALAVFTSPTTPTALTPSPRPPPQPHPPHPPCPAPSKLPSTCTSSTQTGVVVL